MENRFGIGSVLGTGFKIWFKNLLPFMLITSLIYIPVLIWGIATVQGEPELVGYVKSLETFTRASIMIVPLSNIFVSAALTYGVVMELQGQHASIGSCIATGLSRFFPVLGVAFLTALAVAGGTLLLIVPGIIIFCMLYVATQASVLERPGIMGALRRSRELTDGHKMEIFGLLFLLGLMNFGATKIIETIMVDPTTITPENVYGVIRKYMYVDLARAVIVGSIGAVMAAVAYFQLRNEKEGTSASELARVFE
ncbi:MAG: hypothetical protein M3680_00650 [Myxococcota bacterium]|nr:hypothetical protein [Myxococcota bacterium]